MPSDRDKPTVYTVEGGVLSLSGSALEAFLRDVLARGVPFRFSARGMSMDPFIRDGDAITIVPLASGRPVEGDVVALCSPRDGRLIVHRVVAAGPAGFVVRGDANDDADGVVTRQEVLGQVSAVHRGDRRVVAGSGPERRLIALLSRFGLLRPLVDVARRTLAWLRRRRRRSHHYAS